MKTVEIAIRRTEAIRVPISVPDHWDAIRIRQSLNAFVNPATLDRIADEIGDRGWEWDNNHGYIAVDAIYLYPEYPDDEPVFTFPDEDAPAPAPNPDQLGLLEAA